MLSTWFSFLYVIVDYRDSKLNVNVFMKGSKLMWRGEGLNFLLSKVIEKKVDPPKADAKKIDPLRVKYHLQKIIESKTPDMQFSFM